MVLGGSETVGILTRKAFGKLHRRQLGNRRLDQRTDHINALARISAWTLDRRLAEYGHEFPLGEHAAGGFYLGENIIGRRRTAVVRELMKPSAFTKTP